MPRVLVVDDEDLMREMLRDLLEEAGYEVIDAGDGRTGLDLCQEEAVDVIILDILMPEQEGLETIRGVRHISPGTGIIAISGGGHSGARDYLSFATEFGAHRTFAKPFDSRALLGAVAELIEQINGESIIQ